MKRECLKIIFRYSLFFLKNYGRSAILNKLSISFTSIILSPLKANQVKLKVVSLYVK